MLYNGQNIPTLFTIYLKIGKPKWPTTGAWLNTLLTTPKQSKTQTPLELDSP